MKTCCRCRSDFIHTGEPYTTPFLCIYCLKFIKSLDEGDHVTRTSRSPEAAAISLASETYTVTFSEKQWELLMAMDEKRVLGRLESVGCENVDYDDYTGHCMMFSCNVKHRNAALCEVEALLQEIGAKDG